jgi:hypothetical protein
VLLLLCCHSRQEAKALLEGIADCFAFWCPQAMLPKGCLCPRCCCCVTLLPAQLQQGQAWWDKSASCHTCSRHALLFLILQLPQLLGGFLLIPLPLSLDMLMDSCQLLLLLLQLGFSKCHLLCHLEH